MLGQQPSGLSSLTQASALLDISVQALQDTQQEGLQPTDMVSLIQLLSLAADIPTELLTDATNRSQDSIQEFSQHFISVADSIISEDNALKWQAIKEVMENCIFLYNNWHQFHNSSGYCWDIIYYFFPQSNQFII